MVRHGRNSWSWISPQIHENNCGERLRERGWRRRRRRRRQKRVWRSLVWEWRSLARLRQKSHFPAKKCDPKCELSLPKCESHLPKLRIGVPIRQKIVNRCESMAKSLAWVAVLWHAFTVHGSRQSLKIHKTFPKTRSPLTIMSRQGISQTMAPH